MRGLVLSLLVLAIAAPALAQDRDGSATRDAASRSVSRAPASPVDSLPVSLDRIRAGLRQAPPIISPAEYRYFVQVYGASPTIELFTKEDQVEHGPAPYGAPTHQDFLTLWTPEAFRAPPMDLAAVMRWIAGQLQKKGGG